MKNAVRDYIKADVLGSANTDLAKKLLAREQEYQNLLKYSNKDVPYILTCTPAKQKSLLDAAINKYGKITFYNSVDKVVKIVAVDKVAYNKVLDKDDVLLQCAFVTDNRPFTRHPWLTTMLTDGSTFRPNIAKTVNERLSELKIEIEKLRTQIDAEYVSLKAAYDAEVNSHEKIMQEAVTGKKICLDKAEALTVAIKSRDRIKAFTTLLSADELRTLMEWICSNIYSIKVYGLSGGRSGKLLQDNYSEVPGIHYRTPARDTAGRVVSQDGISGELYFCSTKNAPESILRKVCSNKRGDTLFKGALSKRLCDKNLALYLLAEYGRYGFVAGEKKLNQKINKEALLDNEFQK